MANGPLRSKGALDTIANIAVIAAAVTFIWLSMRGYFQWSDGSSPPAQAEPVVESIAESVHDLSVGNILSTGRPKLAIVEFSDFQCPFCAQHSRSVFRQLRKDFVDTGQVAYVFMNLPLELTHPFARRASEAAECAAKQGRFWDMHDALFLNQASLAEPNLPDYARSVKLDLPTFNSCLNGETLSRIWSQMEIAQRLEVKSTPTFFVGRLETADQSNGGPTTVALLRRLRGAQPYGAFTRAIDEISSP
jgi:protein-disulfide isomerase